MSLLVDIAMQSLDPGYAEAAASQARSVPTGSASGEPGGTAGPATRRRGPWLSMGGVLAATLLIVVAGVQAHRHAPAASRTRQTLLDQVKSQTSAVADLQRRLGLLRDRTTGLRDRALATSSAGLALQRRLATEELVAGTVAATGPGLQVTLDDAPTGPGADNRILDRDLQAVVNALWAAGAEAVAIGDQRLTGQSAIRQAGSAILVNFQPVSPPYVIQALGDPVQLETSFATSRTAARMRSYVQLYGLRFRYARSSSLRIAPAPGLTLRYAEPVAPHRSGGGP
jgi:uncharacterized protein YlxW (UPF0749 family)